MLCVRVPSKAAHNKNRGGTVGVLVFVHVLRAGGRTKSQVGVSACVSLCGSLCVELYACLRVCVRVLCLLGCLFARVPSETRNGKKGIGRLLTLGSSWFDWLLVCVFIGLFVCPCAYRNRKRKNCIDKPLALGSSWFDWLLCCVFIGMCLN